MNSVLRYVVLALLGFGVLHASETNIITRDLGDFTVKAFIDTTDDHWKMQVFKKGGGKVFQELRNVPMTAMGQCDTNLFLGNYTNAKNEHWDFVYICELGYSPEAYEYVPEIKKFYGDEFSFGANLDALLNTKDFYIGASYSYYNEYEQAQKNLSLYIFKKPANDMIQRIDIPCDTDRWSEVCETDHIKIGDYNFDGIDDFALVPNDWTMGTAYYLYDTKKGKFVMSFFGANLVFDYKNKTVTDSYSDEMYHSVSTHKIVNNKLVEISKKCAVFIGFESEISMDIDCAELQQGGKLYLRSIGLKNNFELELTTLDFEEKKAVVFYKGQKSYINLALKSKNSAQSVYDEIVEGKITGTYIINSHNIEGVKGVYIRARDGKRFELENSR